MDSKDKAKSSQNKSKKYSLFIGYLFILLLVASIITSFYFYHQAYKNVIPTDQGEQEASLIFSCIYNNDDKQCLTYYSEVDCHISDGCMNRCVKVKRADSIWNYAAISVSRALRYIKTYPKSYSGLLTDHAKNNKITLDNSPQIIYQHPFLKRLETGFTNNLLPEIPYILLNVEYVICWKSQLHNSLLQTGSSIIEQLDFPLTCPQSKATSFCSFKDATKILRQYSPTEEELLKSDVESSFEDTRLERIDFETKQKPKLCFKNICYYRKEATKGLCGKEFLIFQEALELDSEVAESGRNFVCCIQGLQNVVQDFEMGFKSNFPLNDNKTFKIQNKQAMLKYCSGTTYTKDVSWWIIDQFEDKIAQEERVLAYTLIINYTPPTEESQRRLLKSLDYTINEDTGKFLLSSMISEATQTNVENIFLEILNIHNDSGDLSDILFNSFEGKFQFG